MSANRAACDGGYLDEWAAAFHDRMALHARSYAHHAQRAYTAQRWLSRPAGRWEDALVRALLTAAERRGDIECAALTSRAGRRSVVAEEPEEESEAERLVREHGLAERAPALRGLARSRGLDLEVVLRAWSRGELRTIVQLPRTRPATGCPAAPEEPA